MLPFYRLTWSPKAENFIKACMTLVTKLWSALENKSRSSTNIKWVRCNLLHLGWKLKSGLFFRHNSNTLYLIKANKKGERGSPCLKPFLKLKGQAGLPKHFKNRVIIESEEMWQIMCEIDR